MLHKGTLSFLQSLKANNQKEWFEANRHLYSAAKEDVAQQVVQILKYLATFNPLYADLKPSDCMFRINRDVRFSKDKVPYKTNIGAYMSVGGKKSPLPGFYLHVEPSNSFVAAGVWMPEKNVLFAIRQEIDYNLPTFKKIITAPSFKKYFPQGLSQENALQRVPKGYDELNEAAAYLKLKSFIVVHPLSNAAITSNDFLPIVQAVCKAAQPLNIFLETAMG